MSDERLAFSGHVLVSLLKQCDRPRYYDQVTTLVPCFSGEK